MIILSSAPRVVDDGDGNLIVFGNYEARVLRDVNAIRARSWNLAHKQQLRKPRSPRRAPKTPV